MGIEEIRRVIKNGSEDEKIALRDYFKKYGSTYEKEVEVHEILVNTILNLNVEERIALSGIIGYPVFLRICLIPKIRHRFPLLQDGAALIILDDENHILVQQRMDNGKYGFSGGCQELGEELTDVSIRECYEETGLMLNKEKIVDVYEVSGLSRRNSYPNGDVVVNNTALYIGYLADCEGNLRKDNESKEVSFKTLSFLEQLPQEQKHESDFIEILKLYLQGKNPRIQQPILEMEELPVKGDMSFADYLYSLTPEQALVLAKQMGYHNFLMSSLDERIRDIFPHLEDKSIMVALNHDHVLVYDDGENISLPKQIQSVGETFEDALASFLGINAECFKLALRLSGQECYMESENGFVNAMVFEPTVYLEEQGSLRYVSIEEAKQLLSKEDNQYLNAYLNKYTKNVKTY